MTIMKRQEPSAARIHGNLDARLPTELKQMVDRFLPTEPTEPKALSWSTFAFW